MNEHELAESLLTSIRDEMRDPNSELAGATTDCFGFSDNAGFVLTLSDGSIFNVTVMQVSD